VLFLLKNTGFWPSYCQISNDQDRNLHTPTVVWNTDMGLLRTWSAHGRLQAKPKRLFFVILVTRPKSYIETTDRRKIGGKLSKWRWGWVLLWKIPAFVVWVETDPKKQQFFVFLGYPWTILRITYRKQFYPQTNIKLLLYKYILTIFIQSIPHNKTTPAVLLLL